MLRDLLALRSHLCHNWWAKYKCNMYNRDTFTRSNSPTSCKHHPASSYRLHSISFIKLFWIGVWLAINGDPSPDCGQWPHEHNSYFKLFHTWMIIIHGTKRKDKTELSNSPPFHPWHVVFIHLLLTYYSLFHGLTLFLFWSFIHVLHSLFNNLVLTSFVCP